ncbi:MAG: GAF domain-containing protein, partial [Acidobacteria bacterium]|nr:GAF domain-containing protein [Acidobacteriota bacterium]
MVGKRAGFPVLRPESVRLLARAAAPAPQPIAARQLCGLHSMGTLISMETRILEIGANAAGDTLKLRDRPCLLQVFLPRGSDAGGASPFVRLAIGDRIRVTGVAMQYSPAPRSGYHQILISSAASIVLLERSWPVPPYILLIILLSIIGTLGVWWMRMRRLARLRQVVRAFGEAGESVLGATSAASILARLSRQLGSAREVAGVRIYLANPVARTLDSVTWEGEPARHSIHLEQGGGFLAVALRSSYRNRALLVFAENSKSPLAREKNGSTSSHGPMLVPLLRHGEIAGVLQLDYSADARAFPAEEQLAAQHLGNVVAIALERIEQQSVRERLFRMEKLAAVGQLISSVATDLNQPLDAISQTAKGNPETLAGAADALRTIGREAARAAELVARLVTIAQTEQPDALVVDLRALLDTISAYRREEWESQGLNVRVRLLGEPVNVLGSATQLEQVFLNLLARAEQASASSLEKSLSLALTATGRRVQVEIAFSHDPRQNPDEEGSEEGPGEDPGRLGFGVLRGIIQSHGGEIRVVRAFANFTRFEVEMALHEGRPGQDSPAPEPASRAARPLTVLVVEPDEAVRRDLIQFLSARRHRAVPVSSSEEGLDLVFRIRFDGAFCAIRVPGSHWLRFHEAVKGRLEFFVLLTEAYDEAVTWSSSECDGFVLRKPVNAEEITKLLETLETRGANQSQARVPRD